MDDQDRRAPRLRIDPSVCDGVGVCAHLAASLISIDIWGYPILAAAPLDRRTLPAARAAVRACPHRALFLD
ncbi:MAG TPA: ferredoxin [Jatrophihabitans sp.]|nr:ferredoxin [Jatrophihabitans sp.]